MALSKRRSAPLALFAILLMSCGGEKRAAPPDSGTTDTDSDADADSDSDADGGTDSGAVPVDPEIDWVEVEAGSFTFGSPPGTPCMGPVKEEEVPVTLTHPFLMSKYELTQTQWHALGFTVPPNVPVCDDCPVMYVNWFEALAWCNALSRFEGREECYDLSTCEGEIGNGCPEGFGLCGGPIEEGNAYDCEGKTRKYDSMYDCAGYRLPTGPEWEYAAKAGTTTTTYNGDITTDASDGCVQDPVLDDIAWYCFNTGYMNGPDPWSSVDFTYLQQVGLKQPNPFGLYDMLGNAREWTDYVETGFSLDDNEGNTGEALVDPMGADEEQNGSRDVRSYFYGGQACLLHASYQFADSGGIRGPGYGFRPVRTLPSTAPDGGTGDAGVK
jgi:formylglycine-generating enzyme required for sulfatase activity